MKFTSHLLVHSVDKYLKPVKHKKFSYEWVMEEPLDNLG